MAPSVVSVGVPQPTSNEVVVSHQDPVNHQFEYDLDLERIVDDVDDMYREHLKTHQPHEGQNQGHQEGHDDFNDNLDVIKRNLPTVKKSGDGRFS